MLLTCVLSNYNHAHFLEERIGSILQELPQDSELIIVDDASQDHSRSIIDHFVNKDSRCRVIYHPVNQGLEATINSALQEARGLFFSPMGADDILLSGGLHYYAQAIHAHPDALLFFSDDGFEKQGIRDFRHSVKTSQQIVLLDPRQVTQLIRKRALYIPGHAVVLRKDAVLKLGGYRKELGSFSDAFINLGVAFSGPSVYIQKQIACWRELAGSYSARCKASAKLQHSIAHSIFYNLSSHPQRFLFRRSGAVNRYVRQYPLGCLRFPNLWGLFISAYTQKLAHIGY